MGIGYGGDLLSERVQTASMRGPHTCTEAGYGGRRRRRGGCSVYIVIALCCRREGQLLALQSPPPPRAHHTHAPPLHLRRRRPTEQNRVEDAEELTRDTSSPISTCAAEYSPDTKLYVIFCDPVILHDDWLATRLTLALEGGRANGLGVGCEC